MRNFSIDIIWAKIQMAITAIGGWIGYFVGGVDGLMTALLIFMVLDYITGLMCAIADKQLSSAFMGAMTNGYAASSSCEMLLPSGARGSGKTAK